jgi:cysteine desulfurase
MSQDRFYYFDNNATTRVAPEVADAMIPVLRDGWANPSSAYRIATEVHKAVENARANAGALIKADPKEIIFTSCGTESNNAAIHSALVTQPGKRHVITTAVEHSANINYGEFLRSQGHEVTLLPVESDGSLDIHLLEKSIRPDTAIVSAMLANNETGVMFPIEEIAALCRSKGVLCHTDAVQTPGKIISTSSHWASISCRFRRTSSMPRRASGCSTSSAGPASNRTSSAGHQERGRRGGTENVPHIIGFGRAAELAQSRLQG